MKCKLHLLVGVVLLVSFQTAWCLFDCGVYDNPSKQKLERCAEVVEVLENALFSSKANLHILRDAFLSGSYPSPSLLGVIYDIKNERMGKRDHMEVQWSSSRVFTMIDPTTIHALQPGIMTLIYYLEGISFLQTINLYLDVQTDQHFSESEYNYAIVAITERLRAYAVHQKPLSDWDEHNKGFVIFSASRSLSKKVVIYGLIPTTTVLLLIVALAFSFKMITKLSTLDQSYQAHVKISLFWSFISVLQLTNGIEVLIQVLLTIVSVTGPDSLQINDSTPLCLMKNRVIHIVKVVFILFVSILGLCIGSCCNKKRLPPNPTSRKMYGSSDPDIDHEKAVCNIFLLVFFASTSFITTAALLFVHPVLVLSTVAYISTSIFCTVAVLAVPSSFGMIADKFEKQGNINEYKQNCAHYILYIITIITGSLLMLLILIIISNADNTYTTGIFQDSTSFLPSAILGGIGYLAKKKLTAKSKEKLKLSEDVLDAPRHKWAANSLEIAEEGEQVLTNFTTTSTKR